MFKTNEGNADRLVRITLGLMSLALGYTSLSGTAQSVAYFLGVALVITGSVGYCGIYALFGINTCPVKKK